MDLRRDTGTERIIASATNKNRRSAKVVAQLTGWPMEQCLEFAVLFEWHISQAGGVDKLIAGWRAR